MMEHIYKWKSSTNTITLFLHPLTQFKLILANEREVGKGSTREYKGMSRNIRQQQP